ncbi:hypothetical protein Sviol_60130 [Streptomyces violascens]|uniref:Uncharacterized protein n=1 Tax=Streptomyces violascens TaxID=67381 RepID=A0ABQ3QWH5_9ACTN|nr:hypothetical protein Sviol_60130 [Streptomyces violascens]
MTRSRDLLWVTPQEPYAPPTLWEGALTYGGPAGCANSPPAPRDPAGRGDTGRAPQPSVFPIPAARLSWTVSSSAKWRPHQDCSQETGIVCMNQEAQIPVMSEELAASPACEVPYMSSIVRSRL